MLNTPESQYTPRLFKNRVKPNFTPSVSREPKRWVSLLSLVDVASLEQVLFFYDLDGLDGIRSTQPTILPVRGDYFSKIDTYGAVRKPYLPGVESVYLFLEFTII